MEVLERLERNADGGEVLGETVAREHSRSGERDAPIRVAIADVDEAVEASDVRALARLTADRARLLVPKTHAPALRLGIDSVGADVELETFPFEDGLDELVEAAGDDQRTMPARELGEAGTQTSVRSYPGDDLVEWGPNTRNSPAITSWSVSSRPRRASCAS